MVCIRLDGRHTASDGSAYFDYVVRVFAFAGKPYIRVLYRIVNTDDKTGPEKVEGWGWEMKVPGVSTFALAGDPGKLYTGSIGGNSYIFQDGNASGYLSLMPHNKGRYKLWYKGAGEGQKARGLIDVSGGSGGVTAVVRNFWQQYPNVLEAKPGLLTLWLHAPKPWNAKPFGSADPNDEPVKMGYAIGLAKTHELLFNFHSGDMKSADSEALAAVFQEKPFAKATPAHYCASGAFGPMSATAAMKSKYPRALDATFEHIRFIGDRAFYFGYMDWSLYGDTNFGETKTIKGGNHFVEAPRCLALQFLLRDTYGAVKLVDTTRSGKRGFTKEELAAAAKDNKSTKFLFDKLEAGVRHHMDIDVMHCNKAKGRHKDLGPGMHWASNCSANCRDPQGKPIANHRRAAPEERTHYHNWGGHPGGLYEYYMLTGDRFARETLVLQGDFYVKLYDAGFTEKHGEAQHAWPLWTLCRAYEMTGDKKYLDTAARVVKFLIAWWNEPGEYWKRNRKTKGYDKKPVDHPAAYWVIDDVGPNILKPKKPNTGFTHTNSSLLLSAVVRFREISTTSKTGVDDKTVCRMLAECALFLSNKLSWGCRGDKALRMYPFLYAASLLPSGAEKARLMKVVKAYSGSPPYSRVTFPKWCGDTGYRSSVFCRPNEMGPSTFLWNTPHFVALWEEMQKGGKLK